MIHPSITTCCNSNGGTMAPAQPRPRAIVHSQSHYAPLFIHAAAPRWFFLLICAARSCARAPRSPGKVRLIHPADIFSHTATSEKARPRITVKKTVLMTQRAWVEGRKHQRNARFLNDNVLSGVTGVSTAGPDPGAAVQMQNCPTCRCSSQGLWPGKSG